MAMTERGDWLRAQLRCLADFLDFANARPDWCHARDLANQRVLRMTEALSLLGETY